MIDSGILRAIATTQHDGGINVRDLTAHAALTAMRVYIRGNGQTAPDPTLRFAKDLGWRDPEDAYLRFFHQVCERLDRHGVSVRHVQLGYDTSDGWLPRLKIFACLEDSQPRTCLELMALWRAMGAPMTVAQALSCDGEGKPLEHIAVIAGGDGKFASGESYEVPLDRRMDCLSVEREADQAADPVFSRYVAWQKPIEAIGLARMTGSSPAASEKFLSILDIESTNAITVTKRANGRKAERGVSLELRRHQGEGSEF
jgi:hypothetical protein